MESKRCNIVVLSMHVGIDVAEIFEIVIDLIILTFQATYFTLNAGNIDVWLITSIDWI